MFVGLWTRPSNLATLNTRARSTVTVEREHRYINAIHSNNNHKHNSEKTTNVQLEVEKVNVVFRR